MKISIVTISFNQARYLPCAIESVLGQEYEEVEYILVDPGSQDGSREIIDAYGDGIAVRVFENDRGAADGLNKGFARSSGDLLGFINADDMLLPDALQKVADFLRMRPDCDIVAGNGFIVDDQGRPVSHVRARHITPQRYLHGQRTWIQQSIFFRRSVFFGAGGFNAANRTCWDGELFVQMLRKGAQIGYVAADLAAFRIHSASLTGTGTNRHGYQANCRKLFHENTGRDWALSDTVLAWAYRAENALYHLKDWWISTLCI